MLLKITHTTRYRYDAPLGYALQRLRLEPRDGPCQKVLSWAIRLEGAKPETEYDDHHGNRVRLVSAAGEPHVIEITGDGQVETTENAGILGTHGGPAPLWLYARPTRNTAAGKGINELSSMVGRTGGVDEYHRLMEKIATEVGYKTGETTTETTAEEALKLGSGVCQDHAHIMIAAARAAGAPARYISGYLMMNDRVDQAASHAWAEVHIAHLGWVGFDPSNGISPDERYVRVACGCDYEEARPVAGIRHGSAKEALDVHIRVEQ